MVELRRKSKPAPTDLEPPRDPEDWIRRATADGNPSPDPAAPPSSSSPAKAEQPPYALQSDDEKTRAAASAPPEETKKPAASRPSSDEPAAQRVTRLSTERDGDSAPQPGSVDPASGKKQPAPKRRTPRQQPIPPERIPHPNSQGQSATGLSSPATERSANKRRIIGMNSSSEKPGKSPKEPSIHETETVPPGNKPSTKKSSLANKEPIPPTCKETPPSSSTANTTAPPARFISFAMDSLTLDLFRDIAFDLDLGNAATLAHIIETCAALPDEAFRDFPESRVLIGHSKRTMSFLLPEPTIDTFHHLARRLRFRNKSALYRYLIQIFPQNGDRNKC